MSALIKSSPRLSHLDRLESEAIHIIREAAGERTRLALLFSGGKDSATVLHLARKAFWPEKLPFPLLHVDTGHNFTEVLEFRDAEARRHGERLIVRQVEDSIVRGTVKLAKAEASRNAAQSVTLLEAVEEFQFDALIGGARRDAPRRADGRSRGRGARCPRGRYRSTRPARSSSTAGRRACARPD